MQPLLARQRGLLLQRLGVEKRPNHQPYSSSTAAANNGGRPRRPVTASASTPTSSSTPINPPRHGELITTPSNRYVRHCVRLRDSPRHRWEHGAALLVGATLLSELAEAASSSGGGSGRRHPTLPNARVLFVPEDDDGDDNDDNTTVKGRKSIASLAPQNNSCAVVRASRPVLRALAGVPTAGEGAEGEDRLAAAVVDISRDLVAYLKGGGGSGSSLSSAAAAADQAARVLLSPPSPSTQTTPTNLRLLALESVQDPGNLGTLLRTAAAFGWQGAWLLPGCADPFGAKAVRAARGAQLRSPLVLGPGAGWDALGLFARKHNAKLVAAALPGQVEKERKKTKNRDGDRNDDDETPSSSNNVILVLGSEGQGLSAEALRRCDASLSVPMVEGAMESLNVAVAGGVLMFALGAGVGASGGKRRKTAAASPASASTSAKTNPAVKSLIRDIDALF